MPKIKTHRATAKRVRRTGKGLKRRNAYATHLLGGRSSKRKRQARRNEAIAPADLHRVQRAMGMK
jgi:large subunit ribosomal protein L35